MKNLHLGALTRVNQHLNSSRSSEVINLNTKVATVCKNVMEFNKKTSTEKLIDLMSAITAIDTKS